MSVSVFRERSYSVAQMLLVKTLIATQVFHKQYSMQNIAVSFPHNLY